MLMCLRITSVVAVALNCGACNPHYYLDRRETISLAAGTAVHANMVTQVADPWPRQASDNRIVHEGNRIQQGINRLDSGKVYDPSSKATPGGVVEKQTNNSGIIFNLGNGGPGGAR
jgi:hypothetical protein